MANSHMSQWNNNILTLSDQTRGQPIVDQQQHNNPRSAGPSLVERQPPTARRTGWLSGYPNTVADSNGYVVLNLGSLGNYHLTQTLAQSGSKV